MTLTKCSNGLDPAALERQRRVGRDGVPRPGILVVEDEHLLLGLDLGEGFTNLLLLGPQRRLERPRWRMKKG